MVRVLRVAFDVFLFISFSPLDFLLLVSFRFFFRIRIHIVFLINADSTSCANGNAVTRRAFCQLYFT